MTEVEEKILSALKAHGIEYAGFLTRPRIHLPPDGEFPEDR